MDLAPSSGQALLNLVRHIHKEDETQAVVEPALTLRCREHDGIFGAIAAWHRSISQPQGGISPTSFEGRLPRVIEVSELSNVPDTEEDVECICKARESQMRRAARQEKISQVKESTRSQHGE